MAKDRDRRPVWIERLLVIDDPVYRMTLVRLAELNLTKSDLDHLSFPAIVPWDLTYDTIRQVINRRFIFFPLVIAIPATIKEVQYALKWGRKFRLEIRIRGGGHDYEGASSGSGLTIDLVRFSGLRLDKNHHTLQVGAGARINDVLCFLQNKAPHWVLPTGVCPTVGMMGLALGGGIGFLLRTLGTTSDHIVEIEMILVDGRYVVANEDHYSDLLWACRGGGGGNFGIVTSITFKLSRITTVTRYVITWPFSYLEAVIELWQNALPGLDKRVNTELAASGQNVNISGLIVGDDKSLVNDFLQPFLSLGTPTTDIQTGPYYPTFHPLTEGKDLMPFFKDTSDFVNQPLPDEAIEVIRQNLIKGLKPDAGNSIEFKAFGGIMDDISPTATAFPHRINNLFSIQYITSWSFQADNDFEINWAESFKDDLRPYVNGFSYVNYRDYRTPNYLTSYYGPNVDRLVDIKRRYDPSNVLSSGQPLI